MCTCKITSRFVLNIYKNLLFSLFDNICYQNYKFLCSNWFHTEIYQHLVIQQLVINVNVISTSESVNRYEIQYDEPRSNLVIYLLMKKTLHNELT